jgi:hypothetical protein
LNRDICMQRRNWRHSRSAHVIFTTHLHLECPTWRLFAVRFRATNSRYIVEPHFPHFHLILTNCRFWQGREPRTLKRKGSVMSETLNCVLKPPVVPATLGRIVRDECHLSLETNRTQTNHHNNKDKHCLWRKWKWSDVGALSDEIENLTKSGRSHSDLGAPWLYWINYLFIN